MITPTLQIRKPRQKGAEVFSCGHAAPEKAEPYSTYNVGSAPKAGLLEIREELSWFTEATRFSLGGRGVAGGTVRGALQPAAVGAWWGFNKHRSTGFDSGLIAPEIWLLLRCETSAGAPAKEPGSWEASAKPHALGAPPR